MQLGDASPNLNTIRDGSPKQMILPPLRAVSFGAASAIVTSTGVIIGFGAAGLAKSAIIAGLLIVGLTDNLTDALSIHIFQESELQEEDTVFRTTLINFATRLTISLSFVALALSGGLSPTPRRAIPVQRVFEWLGTEEPARHR